MEELKMSKAFKCDRCGMLYEKNELLNINYVAKTGLYGNNMDLCDTCFIKLHMFMENNNCVLYNNGVPIELPTVDEVNK